MRLSYFPISDDDVVWIAESDATGSKATVIQANHANLAELLRRPRAWFEALKIQNKIEQPRSKNGTPFSLNLSGPLTIEFRYGWQAQPVNSSKGWSRRKTDKIIVKGETRVGSRNAGSVIQVDLPAFPYGKQQRDEVAAKYNDLIEGDKLIDISLISGTSLAYIHFDVINNVVDKEGGTYKRRGNDDCYDVFAELFYDPSLFNYILDGFCMNGKVDARLLQWKQDAKNTPILVPTMLAPGNDKKETKKVSTCNLSLVSSRFTMTYVSETDAPAKEAEGNLTMQSKSGVSAFSASSTELPCIKLVSQYDPSMLAALISSGNAVPYTGQAYTGLLAPWRGLD